jgi:hypothetical protein
MTNHAFIFRPVNKPGAIGCQPEIAVFILVQVIDPVEMNAGLRFQEVGQRITLLVNQKQSVGGAGPDTRAFWYR